MKFLQAIFFLVVPVFGDDATPLGKVFELLENLRQRILADAEQADKAYSHYAEFCGMTSKQVKYEIDTASTLENKLSVKVSKLAGDIQVGESKVNTFSGDIAKAEAEVKEAKSIRTQEVETFKEGEKQLISTTDTLGRALTTLERQQGNGKSFTQIDSATMTSLVQILSALDDAAAIDSESMDKLTALIQAHDDIEDSTGSPAGVTYNTAGEPIMTALEDMREKADVQLDDLRKNEATASHTYELMMQGLEDEIKATTAELTGEKTFKAQASEEKASAEGNLDITVKEKKVSGEKHGDFSRDCLTAATDHEANVLSRQEELKVLAQAEAILREATGSAASFLQVKATAQVSSKLARARQIASANLINSMEKLAKQHHSAALGQLASRISAELKYSNSRHGADPFKKVKTLVESMISKLEKEASEEATEKAYCDGEMAKTKTKKSELEDTVEKLTAKIEKAASQSAQLKEEVTELMNELSEVAKEQATMDKIRREEHAAHVQTVGDLEKGLNGVRKALSVLRDYYGADDAASLLQADVNSDRDEMSALMQQAVEQPEPPMKAQKSTGAGQGIINILEVCEADLAKNLATEDTEETDAQTSYDKETQINKIAKAQKEQDAKYKTKENKSLDKSISELEADRATDSDELNAVTEYFAKVKERCIAKPTSYDELVARRQAEIDGLKEALASLESQAFVQMSTRRKSRLRGAESLSPDSV